MTALLYGEDPEPCEPGPAGPLFVPVRPGPAGCVARLFRTPVGGRTAVAFTTEQRLRAALGARQPWVRLSEPALRSLTEPLGVGDVTVDPRLAAHAVGHPRRLPPEPRTTDRWSPDPDAELRPAGSPRRLTGAAAQVGALTLWFG
ncbi:MULTISPECIES: SAV_915 family protein [unclassified Streptomyces]|uniref:SAV_915 family protein n=1 Tax=unclassified Streptomyces TaxID=2593676 RepID=UPI0033FF5746